MNQHKIMMICLVAFGILLGGFIFSAIKSSQKSKTQESQWKWDDSWNGNMPSSQSPNLNGKQEKIKPVKPNNQIMAESYTEALKKSEEYKMPVLVVYNANWCAFCKKLKSETFSDAKVIEAMKSYIVVTIDTDKDRSGIAKFSVIGLPTCVITNSKEEKLKVLSGYVNPDTFRNWLNDEKILSLF